MKIYTVFLNIYLIIYFKSYNNVDIFFIKLIKIKIYLYFYPIERD